MKKIPFRSRPAGAPRPAPSRGPQPANGALASEAWARLPPDRCRFNERDLRHHRGSRFIVSRAGMFRAGGAPAEPNPHFCVSSPRHGGGRTPRSGPRNLMPMRPSPAVDRATFKPPKITGEGWEAAPGSRHHGDLPPTHAHARAHRQLETICRDIESLRRVISTSRLGPAGRGLRPGTGPIARAGST